MAAVRGREPHRIVLPGSDQAALLRIVRDGKSEQRIARRARVLLAMADPASTVDAVAEHADVSRKAVWGVCRRYEERGLKAIHDAPRAGRPRVISSLQRVQVEELACCEPAGVGLEMTHWSERTLAKVAVQRGIVPHIAHSTVSLILRKADLHPHRCYYWKTPTLNEEFVQRATEILWCYEHVEELVQRGELVIALDEKPNLQALERTVPRRPMCPGQPEHFEFEYIRHGTVKLVVALWVHSGTMGAWCIDKNDSVHLRPVLQDLFARCSRANRLHLICDGGASHTSAATEELMRYYKGWVRMLLTPAHASWLNQAELLLRAFTDPYLDRGDWKSRQSLIQHLGAAEGEYNHLLAHPFHWSWTTRRMEEWVAKHV